VIAGGKFTASGTTSLLHVAKLNSNTWTSMGAGINSNVNALEEHNSVLHAGCDGPAELVYKYDGSTWSPLSGLSSGKVLALASFDNYLYAGGDFNAPSPAGARHDGSTWSTMITAFSPTDVINAFYVSPVSLYLGGKFSNLGIPGSATSFAAKVDSTAFPIEAITIQSSMLNGEVYALGFLQVVNAPDVIYAGGQFSSHNNVSFAATTIGIDDVNNLISQKSIFPNPVYNYASVKITSTTSLKNPELKVFDLQSKLMKIDITTKQNNNNLEFTLNCNGLASGNYYYILFSDGKATATEKFVVH
jgi:hypothetical protein